VALGLLGLGTAGLIGLTIFANVTEQDAIQYATG